MPHEPITREQYEAVLAEVAELRAELAEFKALVVELKAQLAAAKKTPRNSSKPPSTEHPHAKPTPPPHARPKTSNGKPGGQPGHEKSARVLVPVEQCASVIDHKPDACRGCGSRLNGSDPAPERKQVWDIPPIVPVITEHRLHRLTCTCCGKVTGATLPEGMPTCEAGPRLVSLVAYLMAGYRGSKRKTAEFVRDVLNIPCSIGWIVKLQNVAQAALRPQYDALASRLTEQSSLNIDESPTKQAKSRAWVWTFVAATFTVFTIRLSRKSEPLHEYLGEAFRGIVGSDRAKMYHSLERGQWCWAHLIRDFQSWIDSTDGSARRLGRDLLRPIGRMFELWWKVRDGTLNRMEFQTAMRPIRVQVRALLLRGVYGPSDLVRPTCAELFKHEDRLWQFVDHANIEPTNNSAERSLRQAVILRKLSYGTQSAAGSRFLETLLTVLETCRQQGRGAFGFITATMQARYNGTTAPKLTGA